jgi:hypothetical protein
MCWLVVDSDSDLLGWGRYWQSDYTRLSVSDGESWEGGTYLSEEEDSTRAAVLGEGEWEFRELITNTRGILCHRRRKQIY